MDEQISAMVRNGIRVLLCRPDHLGDVLLSLPAATALRRMIPSAHLTYLVSSGLEDVPGHCPDIDEVYSLPFPPPDAPPDPFGWADLVAGEAANLSGRFDLALLLRPGDPWSGALVKAGGVPIRLGYAHPLTRPFLTAALRWPVQRHATAQALDLVSTMTNFLNPLRKTRIGAAGPLFVPTASDEAEAAAVLAQFARSGRRPIVVHPGTGWPLKNWSADKWRELVTRLQVLFPAPILVTGQSAETQLIDLIVGQNEGSAQGLAGQLSLGGLAALCRRAHLVIANDSGPLHLAAAMGAPVVGLYGPVDPQEFGPLAPSDRCRIVRVPVPCGPCGRVVDPPCGVSTDPLCLRTLDVEAVLTAAVELVGLETAHG